MNMASNQKLPNIRGNNIRFAKNSYKIQDSVLREKIFSLTLCKPKNEYIEEITSLFNARTSNSLLLQP